MTHEESWQLVMYLTAAYPRPEVSQETFAIYVENLLPLEVGAARAAVQELVQTEKFLPPIAAVHEAVRRRQARPKPVPIALPEPPLSEDEEARRRAVANEVRRTVNRLSDKVSRPYLVKPEGKE
jgi:hypothetical protein